LPLTSTLSIESFEEREDANRVDEAFFTPSANLFIKRALISVILSEINGLSILAMGSNLIYLIR